MIPNINLLPTYERQGVVLYRLFITGIIVVFLAAGGLIYTYVHAKNSLTEAENKHQQLTQQQELFETKLINARGDQPESLASVVDFAEEYVVPTSILIEEFMDVLPADAWISTYNYVYGTVNIESEFKTKSDISTYVANLLDSDYIHDVKVDHIESLTVDHSEVKKDSQQRVNYSFDINLAKLKKEAKANE